MLLERVEKLRQEYTDKSVVVESDRADLARFAGKVGQVRTVNAAGRALVEFDGDRGWYDLELDFLRVVEKPKPKEPARKAPLASASPAAAGEVKTPPGQNLSELERARQEKDAKPRTAGEKTVNQQPADATGPA